jgi:hypothetical protein
MRQPSSYAWHTAALAYYATHGNLRGFPGGLQEDEFHVGWYRRRKHSKGPWLPASVSVEAPFDPETGELLGDELWRCEVCGEPRDLAEEWTFLCGQPISREAYTSMLELMFTGELT